MVMAVMVVMVTAMVVVKMVMVMVMVRTSSSLLKLWKVSFRKPRLMPVIIIVVRIIIALIIEIVFFSHRSHGNGFLKKSFIHTFFIGLKEELIPETKLISLYCNVG